MAVVPTCCKLSFKNQSLLHLKDVARDEKYSRFTKWCFYSTRCSSKGTTKNTIEWRLGFGSDNATQTEKRCLVRDTYKSKSVGEQLESLDAYFQKLKLDDANESSSNKNDEFLEQGDPFKDYLGKVNQDEKFASFASSTSVHTTEEVYLSRSSVKGDWEKLKNYAKLKDEDDSELSSSGLYLIGVLVSINIAVFLFEIASPVQNSGLELFSLPSIYGAKINHLILSGEWWRLVTSMFLHSGIVHIGLGSWVLLSFGPRVCRAYGSLTFLLIYLLGGISGNMTSFLQTPDPTVGGTGPVFAIIGAWLIFQFQNKDAIAKDDSESMFQKTIVATGISIILSHFGPIDDWTHLGAISTGIVYGYLTCPMFQMDDKFRKNGQRERIGLVRRYADPCKSVLVFSLLLAVLSSSLFVFEPPINYMGFDSF